MIRVLFVCIHNSARSQMAEAFLNELGKGEFIAESAGLEAGNLNPYVVKAMKEIGYDLLTDEIVQNQNWFKEHGEYFWSDEWKEQVEKIIGEYAK